MIKKKAKSKTTAKKTAKKKREEKAKPETNPAEVRKEVAELVKAGATEMAQAVIGEGKKGQLAPVKYLFEMASIFPPAEDGTQATTEEDCLARILLDRLKLAAAPGEKNCEAGSAGETDSAAAEKDQTAGHAAAEVKSQVPDEDKKTEGEPEAGQEVLV